MDIVAFFLVRFTYLFYMLADPYLNTDAGTMSPFEHGEVFVLDDGGEVSPTLSTKSISFAPVLNLLCTHFMPLITIRNASFSGRIRFCFF